MEGFVSVRLENTPAVEVVTKAEGPDVDINEFNVFITSDEASYSYRYADIQEKVPVPVGTYTVSAENVSEADALSTPDMWGQARYYGITDPQEVDSGMAPTQFYLVCTMANTAVNVVFDKTIAQHFKNYSVKVYADEARTLEFKPLADGQTPKVGYFNPGTLHYEFIGTYEIENTTAKSGGTVSVEPATMLSLNFEVTTDAETETGTIGDIIINVHTDYVVEDEPVTVDPVKGGAVENE